LLIEGIEFQKPYFVLRRNLGSRRWCDAGCLLTLSPRRKIPVGSYACGKAVMDQNPLREFDTTAKVLSRNPLGIIALFIVLVYGLACIVVITGGSLSVAERMPIVYFLIIFPFAVLGVFTYLVAFRAGQLFAPSDFKKEETYLELQRMSLSAVASLTAAKQSKNQYRTSATNVQIDDVVRSVESAVTLVREGSRNSLVLWVDDNPANNIYERQAFEAVGIRFFLSENTTDALNILLRQSFGAIISDMGRREGPREGYVLLDALRARGDNTPLFFYASSDAPEHKRETLEHGGQGCTNDGQALFEMVTKVIFDPHAYRGGSHAGRKAPRTRLQKS
jgi:CheY-like chemotaxis protein